MRIGIISDIHGNMHALEAVLDDLRTRHLDAVYCLGDLVGYGAFPNEVTERIRVEGIPTIMGNYDDGVGFDRDECGCAYTDPVEKQRGDESLAWTKATVTPDNKAFLPSLAKDIRFEADGKRVLLVHGSPRRINEYLFEDRPVSSFQRLAASSNADIIVFGHTHKPYTKAVDNVLFVNAGSVGKPKDVTGGRATPCWNLQRHRIQSSSCDSLTTWRPRPPRSGRPSCPIDLRWISNPEGPRLQSRRDWLL